MELDSPADAWHAWLGVAVVSLTVAAVTLSVPSSPPPDAAAAANAIDRAAAGTVDATATYDHDAEAVLIDERRIGLRNDAGTAHASVAFGTVTPVRGDDGLAAVLEGASPGDEFADADAFATAAERVRTGDPEWRPAAGTLRVRSVTWGDVRVTLVDA